MEFTEISSQDRQILLRLIHHRRADKRRYPRAPLATQIECPEFMSLAFSRDVSLGGMFIETKQAPSVGSRLNLRFNLDDTGPIVVAIGEVTYHVPGLGVGVQFIDLAPADRERIQAYVEKSHLALQPPLIPPPTS